MKAKTIITTGLLIAMAAVCTLQAQMNFSNFYSQSTRNWTTVSTTVDSLLIATRINNGLVTTRVTMTVHPGGYQNYYYNYTTGVNVPSGYETPIDSIEMTLSFTLPTDFVADSMWLWVNDKPVEAYIQDRTLAQNQYQQIVGRRRDPAILSYSGNGFYSLRIFPASSNVARKIALQFHHTMDDDSINTAGTAFAAAMLPFVNDTNRSCYSYCNTKKAISFMRVTVSAGDLKTFSFSMPGLGSGVFSKGNPLTLSGKDLWTVLQGTITTADPSGTARELLWTGRDLKSAALTAGFTTRISDRTLTFLPEPAARIIVFDMRGDNWNWNDYYRLQAAAMGSAPYNPYYYYTNVAMADRARKYAILAVQSYVDKEQTFNVIIAGKTVRRVFSSPVKGTCENKKDAIAALLAAMPDPAANTFDALSDAISQAPDGISLLISDLYAPADYTVKIGLVSTTGTTGRNYDAALRKIDSLVSSAPEHTMFSINDNWKLGDMALKSGGYVLGGLRNGFNIPYTYEVVGGRRVMLLEMTPLFGSSNPTGLTRLKIQSADLDDIVFTLEGSGTGYFYMPLLRLAGRTTTEKFKSQMAFGISGKLGGLRFSRDIVASGDNHSVYSSFSVEDDVQWAFRKSEWLGVTDYQANWDAIKAIGKEYHIVTQQTSLLALEPGMTLWADTLNQPQNGSVNGPNPVIINNPQAGGVINAFAVRDMAIESNMYFIGAPGSYTYYGTGFNIDSIPMQTISGVGILPIHDKYGSTVETIRLVSIAGNKVVLQLPSVKNAAVVSLYNLTGRRVASKTIDASQCTGSRFTWDLQKEAGIAARGQYVLRVTAGTMEQMFMVSIVGK